MSTPQCACVLSSVYCITRRKKSLLLVEAAKRDARTGAWIDHHSRRHQRDARRRRRHECRQSSRIHGPRQASNEHLPCDNTYIRAVCASDLDKRTFFGAAAVSLGALSPTVIELALPPFAVEEATLVVVSLSTVALITILPILEAGHRT